MSSQTKTKAKKTPAPPATSSSSVPQHEIWQSGRSRWNLRQFRRGRDKQWHFPGQQEGEIVRLVVRKHKWFLVGPALPLLGAIALFLFVLGLSTFQPGLHAIWLPANVITFLIMVVAAVYFVWRDLVLWWLETYIITNKRIIISGGLLQPTRKEIPIEKIQQVGFDKDTVLGTLLFYGTVHIYVPGDDVIIKNAPNPRKVKDAIQGITDEIKAKKAPKEAIPVPADPEMDALLKEMAQGKPPPELPNADEKFKPREDKGGRLSPRRTFGGILRIPCDVHYFAGEFAVMYIQRSRFVLYRQIALPSLGLLTALVLTFFSLNLWFLWSIICLALGVFILLLYTNYADDVYILTNRRIIDIQRRFVFLFEGRVEIEYKQIRDKKVVVHNAWQRLLDVGDVTIETAGKEPHNKIVLPTVDHPFLILDWITKISNYKEEADKVKKANEEKETLHRWFAKVVTLLESKTQNNGVPNLHLLDFWSAVERASAFGWQLIPVSEDSSDPNIAPGLIIHQSPPPGTLMQTGGEIQVKLSKRAF